MQGKTKTLLAALAIVLSLSVGIIKIARADCETCTCIVAGTYSGAVSALCGSVTSAISQATQMIKAHMSMEFSDFEQAIEKKIGPKVGSPNCSSDGECSAYSQDDNVTDNIVNWIDNFWNKSMQPAMKEMTDQLTVLNPDQSRQLTSMRDAADVNRDMNMFDQQEIDSHREQRPAQNVCDTATITSGLTKAGVIRNAYSSAAPTEKLPRSGNAAGTSAAAGPAADMKDRWDDYTSRYCEKDMNNGHAGCASDAPFAGQDTDVAGTIFGRETLDIRNPDTKRTIDDLITNVAEPFVRQPIPANSVNSSDGQRALLAARAYQAKRQTVYDSLYYVVARRTPGSNLGPFVKALRKEAGIQDNLISDNPSHNEIMQAMMSERFRTGKYAAGQVDEPENNQREMIIQTAFQLMQMSDQLDLMDRYSLMLAGQVGEKVKRDKKSGTAVSGGLVK